MAKTSPSQFVKQVRQEISKVTWPDRRETGLSTAMVFLMVSVAAVFFLLIDQGFAWMIKLLFGLGG